MKMKNKGTYRKKPIMICALLSILCVLSAGVVVRAQTSERRQNIQSRGKIDYDNGTIVIDSSDLTYLADEMDTLESNYKINTADALSSIGTYFDAEGNVTYNAEANTADSDEAKTALSFGMLMEGIRKSQSVAVLSQTQATDKEGQLVYYSTKEAADSNDLTHITSTDTGLPILFQPVTAANLTAGTAAWVDGILIQGNGADNAAYYEQGIAYADSRVNTDSASYIEGQNNGVVIKTKEGRNVVDALVGSQTVTITRSNYHNIYISFSRAVKGKAVIGVYGSNSYTSCAGTTANYSNGYTYGFTAHGVYLWAPDGSGLKWDESTTITYVAFGVQ